MRKTNTEGTEVVTIETVKPLLDELAAKAYPTLEKFVRPIK